MAQEQTPWMKHLNRQNADEEKNENTGEVKPPRKKKAPKKKGDGDFYKELEDYLEKEYTRVLAPMKKALAKKQIRILSDEELADGTLPLPYSVADKPHSPSPAHKEEQSKITGSTSAAGDETVEDIPGGTINEKTISDARNIAADVLHPESGVNSPVSIGSVLDPIDDMKGSIVNPLNEVEGSVMDPMNDIQDEKNVEIGSAESSKSSFKGSQSGFYSSSKGATADPSTSSKGSVKRSSHNYPVAIKSVRSIPSKEIDEQTEFQVESRAMSPRGRSIIRSGHINKPALNGILEAVRNTQGFYASCEAVVLKLAAMADKTGLRKISFLMNKVGSEAGLSRTTTKRVWNAIREMDEFFESSGSTPGRGTYVVFARHLWEEKGADREIDKNKSLFSFFQEKLKKDEIKFLEFLFTIHVSGLSVSSDAFSREKERFLLRILKNAREKILFINPTISDSQLLDSMYLEGAVQTVSMWRFVRSQTVKDIARPMAYLISCWEKRGPSGSGGEDIIDRMTLDDIEKGKEIVLLIRHILEDTLDYPEMSVLWKLGGMLLDSDCSKMPRSELSDLIKEESVKVASRIFEAWKFVQNVSGGISYMGKRKQRREIEEESGLSE